MKLISKYVGFTSFVNFNIFTVIARPIENQLYLLNRYRVKIHFKYKYKYNNDCLPKNIFNNIGILQLELRSKNCVC